jgi:hypothetical protein
MTAPSEEFRFRPQPDLECQSLARTHEGSRYPVTPLHELVRYLEILGAFRRCSIKACLSTVDDCCWVELTAIRGDGFRGERYFRRLGVSVLDMKGARVAALDFVSGAALALNSLQQESRDAWPRGRARMPPSI